MTQHYIGIMSGTSADGADAALVDFSGNQPRTLAFASLAFTPALRAEVLALNQPNGADELARGAEVAASLARLYAQLTQTVVAQAGLTNGEIRAIGCHGQTVRHRPERGYTIQLGNHALLAELTGIAVVGDFRSRDVAAGGQGAPLAPAFHDAVFRTDDEARVIINLGGIANLTLLAPGQQQSGFDSGPASALLDLWCQRHLGTPYDVDGAWAASGHVNVALLNRLRAEPYFAAPPPKSTGRDLFNLDWLNAHINAACPGTTPQDTQATLLELTARSVVDAWDRHSMPASVAYLCGGGAYNKALVARMAALAAPRRVLTTDALGVPPQHVEAVAFAWLAKQCMEGRTLDMRATTGAAGPRIYGVVYPA